MDRGEYALWLSCFLFFGIVGFALTLPAILLGRGVTEWKGVLVSASIETYEVTTDPYLCGSPPRGPLGITVTEKELQQGTCTNFLFYYQIEFDWQGQFYNLTACDTYTEIYCQQCPTGTKQIGIAGSSGPRQCPRFTRCSDKDFTKYVVANETRIYLSDYHNPPYVYLADPREIAKKLLISGIFFLCLAVSCWYPILKHWVNVLAEVCVKWLRQKKENSHVQHNFHYVYLTDDQQDST